MEYNLGIKQSFSLQIKSLKVLACAQRLGHWTKDVLWIYILE